MSMGLMQGSQKMSLTAAAVLFYKESHTNKQDNIYFYQEYRCLLSLWMVKKFAAVRAGSQSKVENPFIQMGISTRIWGQSYRVWNQFSGETWVWGFNVRNNRKIRSTCSACQTNFQQIYQHRHRDEYFNRTLLVQQVSHILIGTQITGLPTSLLFGSVTCCKV